MNESRTISISPRPKLVFAEGRTVLLLGLELKLTEGEYTLLRLIYSRAPQTVTADDAGLSPAGLTATVFNINKKAALISGRKLIVSCRGRGYSLSNCP